MNKINESTELMFKKIALKRGLEVFSLHTLDLIMAVLDEEIYRQVVQEVIDEKVAKMGLEKGKEMKL